jgi:predicted nucleic acid-binding protein
VSAYADTPHCCFARLRLYPKIEVGDTSAKADDQPQAPSERLQPVALGIAYYPLWVAAACLQMNAILITRDADFQQIEGLTVEDWTV